MTPNSYLVIAMIISLPTILLIVLILLLLGALPTWPHSRNWGYYPSGGIGLVVLILIIVLLMRGGI
jgi:fumarate reductase subunit D